MKITIIRILLCLLNSGLLYVSDQAELLTLFPVESTKTTVGLSASTLTSLSLSTSIEQIVPRLVTLSIFFRNIKNIKFSDSVTQKSLFSLDISQGVECDLADQIYINTCTENSEGFRRLAAHYVQDQNSDFVIEIDASGKRRCQLTPGHYKIVVDGKLFYYDKAFDR